jgi:hypothetical protein
LLATAGCGASDGSHGCGAATPPPKETSAKIDNILNNSNLADATSNTNNNWNAAHISNHSYSQTGTQYQSNANGYHSYNNAEEVDYNHATSAVSNTISEEQLVSSLNSETRKIYDSLSTQGKALAIQLASQDNYRDKNLAVKEAQKRTEKADVMVR